MRSAAPQADQSVVPAAIVILAGVSAALHVAKLFPALPVLRELLQISLLQAGFLVAVVQLAGMTLGLAVGLLADGIGLKRCMMTGLTLLFSASAFGGCTDSAATLLAFRVVEGAGFLLVCTPAPALIRQLVVPRRLGSVLGVWGTYMPLATTLALLFGPLVILLAGWQSLWWGLSVVSFAMALLLWRMVPAGTSNVGNAMQIKWTLRLHQTLTARGPWLIALSFAMYSGQWIAVVGFLPSIYAQAGFSSTSTAWLTALAAAVNAIGNVASGRLLSRNLQPQSLLYVGFCVMGLTAFVAFVPFSAPLAAQQNSADTFGPIPIVRYVAILLFSLVGGLIPGTLFSLSVALAPGKDTVSTTVGWMQQWSAFGQFSGPPLVAWVASRAGGWQWTWLVTSTCAILGLCLARHIGKQIQRTKDATAI